jgi:hypothetical protein
MTDTPVVRAGTRRPLRLLSIGVMAAAVMVASGACTHRHRHPTPGTQTTHTRPGPATTGTTPTTSTPAANEVTFVLKNGAIEQQGEVKAGANTVHINNVGTIEHEIIFIKADGGATLPTLPNGAADEEALPEGAAIGEAELEAGASETKTFTFTSGKWVAVCNVVSGTNSHFAKGMWMDFSVS